MKNFFSTANVQTCALAKISFYCFNNQSFFWLLNSYIIEFWLKYFLINEKSKKQKENNNILKRLKTLLNETT